MNQDTDLDLAPEEIEELAEDKSPAPVPEATPEIKEKTDILSEGENLVRSIIGQNVFDVDLEKNLDKVIEEHFTGLPKNSLSNTDIFHIPDLNKKIWDAFRDYEDFVHQNKFENINLNEIGAIIREKVVPDITKRLSDLIIRQSQTDVQSSWQDRPSEHF